MSSHTGVTLGYMDEHVTNEQLWDRVNRTKDPAEAPVNAGEPEVEPVNWSKLDPKLTKAIVAAQGAATTVDNDGHNTHHGYRYPTQAAIACKAREAMFGAGIALIQIGWKRAEDGLLYAEFVIVHQDGPVSPVFGATMPVGGGQEPAKKLAAALSILRKYVLAGLLNMGWRDPTEDVDADKPRGQQRQEPQHPQQQNRPAQQTRHVDPVTAYRSKAVQDARSWGKWLLEHGLPKEHLFNYATGRTDSMPKPPPTSVLEAITLAGRTMKDVYVEDGGLMAATHGGLISFMEQQEIVPLWSHGNKTSDGDGVDQKWPIGR